MVDFVIYNSLSRKKEKFEPIEYPFVKIYVCGVTPYDKSHLGHFRTYIVSDLFRRFLRFQGYIDIAISNFTDIDDKIIRKMRETGRDYREIADENIKYTLEALEKLNALPYIAYPRVTKHINDIVKFVKTLIEKGYAYKGKYGIYFEVDKFEDYGKLSGRKSEEWRQETEYLEDKRKPYDFALWKFKKPGEPYWETEIGEGRPGWHIECSAMSIKYLGEQFDIHIGGTDLIFPHHENEIAQSEAYTGKKPWVKYWIHIGMLNLKGEKMSKSLGNIIPILEFAEERGFEETRFYLISTHYRDILEYSDDDFEQKKKNYEYIKNTIKTFLTKMKREPEYKIDDKEIEKLKKIYGYWKEIYNSLLDDLDTTRATSKILKLSSYINKNILPEITYPTSIALYDVLKNISFVYGLFEDLFYKVEKRENIVKKLLDIIVDIRKELRKKKEYELADKIRNILKKAGIVLLDKGIETEWRFT